jgi:hypothetical protein
MAMWHEITSDILTHTRNIKHKNGAIYYSNRSEEKIKGGIYR